MSRRSAALVVPVLAAAACGPDDDFLTESGTLSIEVEGANDLGAGDAPNPVLAGSLLCAVVRTVEASPEGAIECYAQTVEGPGAFEGECLRAAEAGALTWSFEPVPCDANAEGFDPVADRAVLEVVDPDGVDAVVEPIEDAVPEVLAPASGDSFPGDWTIPDGQPYRLVAGAPFRFYPALRRLDDGGTVAWVDSEATVGVATSAGAEPAVERPAVGEVQVTAEEGTAASLSMEIGEATWPLVDVEGVSAEAPAAIEVVVAYNLPDSGGAPAGARAVVRDAEGNLLWGTPVEWSVRGDPLAVDVSAYLPGGDYTLLSDECIAPSRRAGAHASTVTARYGDLAAEARVEWSVSEPSTASDEGWEPSELCQGGGCACDAAPRVAGTAGASALAAIGAAAALRRRRAPV